MVHDTLQSGDSSDKSGKRRLQTYSDLKEIRVSLIFQTAVRHEIIHHTSRESAIAPAHPTH